METLVTIHSHMRHLVLLTAVLATVALLISYMRTKSIGKLPTTLHIVYLAVITLQLLLGIVVLITTWNSEDSSAIVRKLTHAFVMLMSVGTVHMSVRPRKRQDPMSARNASILTAGSLVLMLLGLWTVNKLF
jgi:heme A synthase